MHELFVEPLGLRFPGVAASEFRVQICSSKQGVMPGKGSKGLLRVMDGFL
jgi:hypothetical protein